ncbi:hypothetical protein [Natrononativus amylolyticus]|uniref:hypothetical protein n=1 Tax=Natrononativus amylolyticus TaxID=2963434 RepID=UPI0020CF4C6A|nr:hypothetical protein [Natrononativus amylolyticus]
MNLDELRTVQSKERQKDSLQHLRPSFYQEVGEYIANLEAERERVADAADDPFSSPEVGRLTDEIETAKDVVEAIYERRMGKLVKQASLSAAGMAADDEGLTAEEADLFEDLVDRIRTNKGRVLDVLEGADPETAASSEAARADPPADDAPPTPPDQPAADRADPAADGVSVADAMGGDLPAASEPDLEPESSSTDAPTPPSDAPDPEGGSTGSATPEPAADDSGADDTQPAPETGGGTGADVDRVTVRITRDVGSILGVDDREYTLSSDDVVTLPEQNATPLVDRDAATPLE